jgi:hypothetical protein
VSRPDDLFSNTIKVCVFACPQGRIGMLIEVSLFVLFKQASRRLVLACWVHMLSGSASRVLGANKKLSAFSSSEHLFILPGWMAMPPLSRRRPCVSVAPFVERAFKRAYLTRMDCLGRSYQNQALELIGISLFYSNSSSRYYKSAMMQFCAARADVERTPECDHTFERAVRMLENYEKMHHPSVTELPQSSKNHLTD